jgi:hypothetical protein
LLRFTVQLAVYLVPVAPVGIAYAGAVSGVANALVGERPSAERPVRLHFESRDRRAISRALDAYGMDLSVRDTDTGAVVHAPIDLRSLAYVPTVVFVALSVAAPIWQTARGVWVLVGGLALLEALIAATIAAPLCLLFAEPGPMQLLTLAPPATWALHVFYRSFVAPPGMAFAIPALLWLGMLWLVPAFPRDLRAKDSESTAPA